MTAGERRVSAEVPGPILLWRGDDPGREDLREPAARLTGVHTGPPGVVIGPKSPDFAVFTAALARESRMPAALWLRAPA